MANHVFNLALCTDACHAGTGLMVAVWERPIQYASVMIRSSYTNLWPYSSISCFPGGRLLHLTDVPGNSLY